MQPKISIVVALGGGTHPRALGKNGELLWSIPEDLKRFKALTSGHPVIMGRKTWESIPKKFRPLPRRTNIVITRDGSYEAAGATVVNSFPEALSHAKAAEGAAEIFVIGGGEIYQAALPFVSNLYLTLIEDDKEGDSYFPEYENEFTEITSREAHEWNGIKYEWLDLERA